MSFVEILDNAMYNENELTIKTKTRGNLIGTPYAVDEYDTDENRLGYFLTLADGYGDTVFLDEIVDIISFQSVSDVQFISQPQIVKFA